MKVKTHGMDKVFVYVSMLLMICSCKKATPEQAYSGYGEGALLKIFPNTIHW